VNNYNRGDYGLIIESPVSQREMGLLCFAVDLRKHTFPLLNNNIAASFLSQFNMGGL